MVPVTTRLTPEREQEILRAAYEILREVGYEGLRLDAVALRAKASKATLYRHWSGKAALVADAVRVCKQFDSQPPDTGSLRGDLLELTSRMAATMAGEDGPLLAGLVMTMRCDPEFACQMQAVHRAKPPLAEQICERAVARGELRPEAPVGLVDEVVPALLFMRSFGRCEPLDEAFLAHLVDDILLPLLTR